jgi:hypothetical protein
MSLTDASVMMLKASSSLIYDVYVKSVTYGDHNMFIVQATWYKVLCLHMILDSCKVKLELSWVVYNI